MLIICPTFLGDHSYNKYTELIAKIEEGLLSKESVEINIDYLHNNEIDIFTEEIFIPALFNADKTKEISTKLCSKDKKLLRKCRKILKRNFIQYKPIYMENRLYKLWIEE